MVLVLIPLCIFVLFPATFGQNLWMSQVHCAKSCWICDPNDIPVCSISPHYMQFKCLCHLHHALCNGMAENVVFYKGACDLNQYDVHNDGRLYTFFGVEPVVLRDGSETWRWSNTNFLKPGDNVSENPTDEQNSEAKPNTENGRCGLWKKFFLHKPGGVKIMPIKEPEIDTEEEEEEQESVVKTRIDSITNLLEGLSSLITIGGDETLSESSRSASSDLHGTASNSSSSSNDTETESPNSDNESEESPNSRYAFLGHSDKDPVNNSESEETSGNARLGGVDNIKVPVNGTNCTPPASLNSRAATAHEDGYFGSSDEEESDDPKTSQYGSEHCRDFILMKPSHKSLLKKAHFKCVTANQDYVKDKEE